MKARIAEIIAAALAHGWTRKDMSMADGTSVVQLTDEDGEYSLVELAPESEQMALVKNGTYAHTFLSFADCLARIAPGPIVFGEPVDATPPEAYKPIVEAPRVTMGSKIGFAR